MGRTLVDVLTTQSTHKGIVLTRKACKSETAIPHVLVDYNDVKALIKVPEEHEIHTIISAFGINGTSLSVSQANLIKAAEKSSVTKRFIPSSFAIKYPESGTQILPPLQSYFDSLDLLKTTSLKWAVVHNGTFLDHFFPPSLKSRYNHGTLVIDIPHVKAGIPGTGDELITLTYTLDVARFVIAALDLFKWPRELRVVGETLTFNQLITLAENATGKKFDVRYDSLETLKQSRITELPGHMNDYKKCPKEVLLTFLSIFQRWMAEGLASIPIEGSLNGKFPDIKPLTAQELMEKHWKSL
ncbi:hypothetical protein V2G26_021250 [Clonostachys chloroleuca]